MVGPLRLCPNLTRTKFDMTLTSCSNRRRLEAISSSILKTFGKIGVAPENALSIFTACRRCYYSVGHPKKYCTDCLNYLAEFIVPRESVKFNVNPKKCKVAPYLDRRPKANPCYDRYYNPGSRWTRNMPWREIIIKEENYIVLGNGEKLSYHYQNV